MRPFLVQYDTMIAKIEIKIQYNLNKEHPVNLRKKIGTNGKNILGIEAISNRVEWKKKSDRKYKNFKER